MANLQAPYQILILITPHFNLAATSAFIDPFRAANYLNGQTLFQWRFVSDEGSEVPSSAGLSVLADPLDLHRRDSPDLVLVSSSWTPEMHQTSRVSSSLQTWARRGVQLAALDTGAFILARAGVLNNQQATVHYEHLDALGETFPDVTPSEALFVLDAPCMTCCGGAASTDFGLHILQRHVGSDAANTTARYLFHHGIRGAETSQNPPDREPLGHTTPRAVRKAIALMEAHLETPLTIPEICDRIGQSQRQTGRLFAQHVGKSAVQYYRDIRLDRARGLVTQTDMKLAEVALASGFAGQVHFCRAYRARFGLAPGEDRVEGRVPFEFRAWPMHSPAAR